MTAAGWDLGPLEAALPDPAAFLRRCAGFREANRGRTGRLRGPELRRALDALADLRDDMVVLGAHIVAAGSGAAEAALEEAEELLRFFEAEWIELDDEVAGALAAAPEVAPYRRYLASLRGYRGHLLSAEQEAALAAREGAASEAWIALHDEASAVPGIEALLAGLRHPEHATRHRAFERLHRALGRRAPLLARAYDAVVGDRLAVDRLRGFAHPRAAADLENEVAPAVIDAMLDAIAGQRALLRAWSARKARILGEPGVSLVEEQASTGHELRIGFAEAIDHVAEVMDDVAGAGDVVRSLAATGHIDATPGAEKTGVAYCVSAGTRLAPYVMTSYDGSLGSALTLCHELGHAVHYALSGRCQNGLTYDPPSLVAEIPAVFAERCLLERLGPAELRLDWSLAGVFRQARLTRFELAAYGARARGETLTAELLGELWTAGVREDHGAGAEVPALFRHGWALVPHFVRFRFANYAYAFAHLVGLRLQQRRAAGAASFRAAYRALLEAGGSAGPVDLLRPLGVDLEADDVWRPSFDLLARQLAALAG